MLKLRVGRWYEYRHGLGTALITAEEKGIFHNGMGSIWDGDGKWRGTSSQYDLVREVCAPVEAPKSVEYKRYLVMIREPNKAPRLFRDYVFGTREAAEQCIKAVHNTHEKGVRKGDQLTYPPAPNLMIAEAVGEYTETGK